MNLNTKYVIAICLSIIIGSWIIGLSNNCEGVMSLSIGAWQKSNICQIFFPLGVF